MRIHEYTFGRIIIDGKAYASDIIIFPNRVNPSWWRKEGHLLQVEDLQEVMAESPDVIVVGTGFMGMMKIHREVENSTKMKGIELKVERTKGAVEYFNSNFGRRKLVACLHLTC